MLGIGSLQTSALGSRGAGTGGCNRRRAVAWLPRRSWRPACGDLAGDYERARTTGQTYWSREVPATGSTRGSGIARSADGDAAEIAG